MTCLISGQFRQVISDTGTSFIGGPQSITDDLAQQVGATFDDEYQTYFIDCNAKFQPFVVTIGGKDYSVDPKQVRTSGVEFEYGFVLLLFLNSH